MSRRNIESIIEKINNIMTRFVGNYYEIMKIVLKILGGLKFVSKC